MTMRVQNNQSLFTQNRYNQTNSELHKTLKKLSSGYQINQAGDDAAGLSISEKMRAQVRGLEQARENIADGLSLINVADAGLANIQDPNLVRIRELTIQAANDTMTDEDRQQIQLEINQLTQSIDTIANNTEFNTRKLLNVISTTYTDITKKEIEVTVPNRQQVIAGYIEITDAHLAKNPMDPIIITASFGHISSSSWPDMNIVSPNGERFGYKELYLSSSNPTTNNTNSSSSEASYSGYSANIEEFIFQNPIKGKWLIRIHNDQGYTDSTFKVSSNYHIIGLPTEIEEEIEYTANDTIKLQIGANEQQQLKIQLSDVRSNKLGVDQINVSTQEGAEAAIQQIDSAMRKVSFERSKYGAYMNILEHASKNVSNTSNHLATAESTLREADMAKEMTQLTKNRMLLNSSQAMLVNINQMSEKVLRLLGTK